LDYYFFTNQRNLLYILTKGYLSAVIDWSKKTDDLPGEFDSPFKKILFFTQRQLDLPYSYNTDKTLVPIAICISEDKLQNLGFTKVSINENDDIYIGDVIIPADIFEYVIFKDYECKRSVELRYGDYLPLLDSDKYTVNENIFTDPIPISKNTKLKIPSVVFSEKDDRNLSVRIGAIGNYFNYLLNNNLSQYVLLSDFVNHLLRNNKNKAGQKFQINSLKDFFPEENFLNDDLILISCLIISIKYHRLSDRISHIKEVANKLDISINEDEIIAIYLLIECIYNTAENFNKDLDKIDRYEILLKITDSIKSLEKISESYRELILDMLDTMSNVFDHIIGRNELLVKIKNIETNIIRLFISGFDLYIKEPTIIGKLTNLLGYDEGLYSPICGAVALYLFGMTNGALSFDPIKKKHMINAIPPKEFYNIIFNNDEYANYNFEMIPIQELNIPNKSEKISLDDYELYFQEKRKEIQNHEEILYSIFTNTGIDIKFTSVDDYKDVYDNIQTLITDTKSINDSDLIYFGRDLIKLEGAIRIVEEVISIGDKSKIHINSGVKIIYPVINNQEIKKVVVTFGSKNKFIKMVNGAIKRFYSESNFENIPLDTKKRIRKYFNERTKSVDKTEVADEKKDFSEKKDEDEPNEDWTKKRIIEYLKDKNIKFKKSDTKEKLLEKIYSKKKIGPLFDSV